MVFINILDDLTNHIRPAPSPPAGGAPLHIQPPPGRPGVLPAGAAGLAAAPGSGGARGLGTAEGGLAGEPHRDREEAWWEEREGALMWKTYFENNDIVC